MTSVGEADPTVEEHALPPSVTANNIILEHAYSEDQQKKNLKDEAVEPSTSSSSSNDETMEGSVVNSTESVEVVAVPDAKPPEPEPKPPELDPKPPDPKPEPEKVKSRELKSLLDAAKESNLDTNIVHKRRSIEPNSSQESGGKRAMRSQNPEFVARHKKFLHKVNKFDLNADGLEVDAQDVKTEKDAPKTPKRKKESFEDESIGGSSAEDVKKNRKSMKIDILNINMKEDKDSFCWRCHRDGILVQCETCPRGFHPRCLKSPVYNPERWPCPECLAILQAESTKTRSPAMKDMSLEHLCELLKFAAKRMINCVGSEPFIHPVDTKTFPDYQNYVVQPMDLTTLQNNIRNNVYGSTVAFMADAKWILHNSIIFNSYQSKLTSAAKSIVKICKQEMSEIETCAECYQNANTKKNSWFVEVCSKPHILLWAKLKGFPYWPAKAMTTNSAGLVDVRFFGAHDRAWIPVKECFLFSKKDPNTTNKARNNIAECVKEVNIHIEKLKIVFGEFYHAPYRTPYDPATELEQLSFMLPKYVPNTKLPSSKMIKSENGEEDIKIPPRREKSVDCKTPRSKSRSRSRASSYSESNQGDKSSDFGDDTETLTGSSKTSLISDGKSEKNLKFSSRDFDKFMEGYGTEEDEPMALNNEARKKIIAYDSESEDETSLKDVSENIKNGNGEHDDELEKALLSRGKVRTRGGYHNVTGKIKILGSRKRSLPTSPTSMESPTKLSRRNSDMSSRSDSSRISGISDKINRVEEFSDMLEVSFQSKDGISSSDTSPEKKSRTDLISTNKADLGKLKPVIQVNTGDLYSKNKEFRISPQSKTSVSIAERLMKKITESESTSEAEKIESVKKQILDNLESSTSTQDNEDVSSSDNSDLKTVESEMKGEINNEKVLETASSSVNSENSDKNQSVSSSTEATSTEPEMPVKTVESVKETKTSDEKTIESSKETKKIEETKQDEQKNNKIVETEEKMKESVKEPSNKLKDKIEKLPEDKTNKDDKLNKSKSETKVDKEKELPKSKPEKGKINNKVSPKENSVKEKEKEKETNIPSKPNLRKRKATKKYDKVVFYDDTDDESYESETSVEEEEEESDEQDSPPPPPEPNFNKTQVKIVNVSDIMSGKVNNSAEKSKPANIVTESIEIKSEPASEDESMEIDPKKGKPRYDVTLTVVDKQKKGKIEENPDPAKPKSGFKITDNMSRIIDSVATNFSKDFEKISKPSSVTLHRKEITLKPISKLIMSPKQKARKSFPNSPHRMQIPTIKKITEKKEILPKPPTSVSVKIPTLQSISPQNSSTTTITTSVPTTSTSTTKDLVYLSQPTPGMTLLPPNQPITLTQNVGNSILAMVHPNMNPPGLILQKPTTTSHIQSNSAPIVATTNRESCTSTTSLFLQPQASEQISQSVVGDGMLSESITKAIGDLLCKAPPKLKPRPPGPLSEYYEEGSPSSAGPTTTLINSISHRLTDYFRGLLKETLNDLTSIGDPESKIRSLELELETVKHKHAEEMLELRKNINSILKDIQKSIIEEKAKIVDETKAACEAERLRCVEEAKSKQWCAFCFKEAQFYCCWNTSYCDYPCQQKHWATHMKTCSQTSVRNLPPGSAINTTTASAPIKPKQTYSNANKTVLKSTRMIVKQTNKQGVPMYVPVQRPLPGGQQTITLVESTPGNFEILGNHGPISLGGKLVPTTTIKVKPGNLITVSSASNNNSTLTTGSGSQKTIIVSQKPQQLQSKPTNEKT